MNIVDILIIIFLLFGVLLGLKRGFTHELVSFLGIFVIIILSYMLKNPLSVFLYNNFPFFNFGGIFKDLTVINILFYEIVAFILVFCILNILFKMLVNLTKVFEKILNMTIILGIPSKILGGIIGALEALIYIFIILYILNLPSFNIKIVEESKLSNTILNNTPVLKGICNDTLYVFNEIKDLSQEYKSTNNVTKFNQKALDIMIDRKIITKENALKLIQKGKIKNVTVS